MLGALNDVLLDRGHRGKIHVRHPHGDAVEALVGRVRSHARISPQESTAMASMPWRSISEVKSYFMLSSVQSGLFDRRYCPPAWAILAQGLALNLASAIEWLASPARR